jgi:single-stranded-DNA-specific exonuclease
MDLKELRERFRDGERAFQWLDFSKLDLSFFELSYADFTRSTLREVNFWGATLVNVNFCNCDLKFAILSNADLTNANLSGADLRGANLSDSILNGVVYTNETQFPTGFDIERLIVTQLQKRQMANEAAQSPEISNQPLSTTKNRTSKDIYKPAEKQSSRATPSNTNNNLVKKAPSHTLQLREKGEVISAKFTDPPQKETKKESGWPILSANSQQVANPSPPQPDEPSRLPRQRWHIHDADPAAATALAAAVNLPPLLAQVLLNRGIDNPQTAQEFLHPETLQLPAPGSEFTDLALSVELLSQAIRQQQKIAICGDYDADGMTSTALLLRALRGLGAQVDYAIPSRMQEGYGLNTRIVEEFQAEGVQVILTVDNGIAAHEPIARARELGLVVIVTDHHDLPPELPNANAILNPKLLAASSAYASLAGVGVAYVLAVSLAQQFGKTQALVTPLLELCTLGTIADLAPLTGVNRRWLRRGLALLPRSQFAGIQALMRVAVAPSPQGSANSTASLKPDTIGFRLGPRINAIGRIGNPQTVIELLTTDDPDIAEALAQECEQANQRRQLLCQQIEQEAIAWVETSLAAGSLDLLAERVLVVVQADWHHGVIGIVASRLVERYGVPVFIGTYEGADQQHIRGSARGIPEFDVFAALQSCLELFDKCGGHRAAGGFSLPAANLDQLKRQLSQFACACLQPEHLRPLVSIDAIATFDELTWGLYEQLQAFQPSGMSNPVPVFCSHQARVLDQTCIGKENQHLRLTLGQRSSPEQPLQQFRAIAWHWGRYFPLPAKLDIAYRLRENTWKDETNLELELIGAQLPAIEQPSDPIPLQPEPAAIQLAWQCPTPDPELVEQQQPAWSRFTDLEHLFTELSGHVLLYGYQRPERASHNETLSLEYDRPSQQCDALILWTLPPSWTHLRWLLAKATPSLIFVRNQLPELPTEETVQGYLQHHLQQFPDQSLNLLALSQHLWIAPCTIVAALRELGYTCAGFPETKSLSQELARLERWYLCPPETLANLR